MRNVSAARRALLARGSFSSPKHQAKPCIDPCSQKPKREPLESKSLVQTSEIDTRFPWATWHRTCPRSNTCETRECQSRARRQGQARFAGRCASLDPSARLRPFATKSFYAALRPLWPECGVIALGRQTPCRGGAVTAQRPKRSGGAAKPLDGVDAIWPPLALARFTRSTQSERAPRIDRRSPLALKTSPDRGCSSVGRARRSQ